MNRQLGTSTYMFVCQPVYNSQRTVTVAIIDIGKQGGREGGSRAEQAFAFLQSVSLFQYFEERCEGRERRRKEDVNLFVSPLT